VGLAQRAVMDFCAQSYENRELVIVGWEYKKMHQLRKFAEQFDDKNIKFVTVNKSGPLPELTWAGVAASEGDWITCWDDDDRNHPGRLARQIQLSLPEDIPGDIPTVFSDSMYHFVDSQEMFVLSRPWRINLVAVVEPRTFLVPAKLVNENKNLLTYDKPGNAWVNFFRRWQGTTKPFRILPGEHKWFVTGVIGDNETGYEAHRNLAMEKIYCWKSEKLLAWKEEINASLNSYMWDAGFSLCGSDGEAFEFDFEEGGDFSLLPVDGLVELSGPHDDVTRIDETVD
jgi:hypothetical protein